MLFINHARYTWILWSISGSLPRLVPSPWTMPAISPHPPAFIKLSCASCAPWRSCHLSLCTSIGSSSSMSSSSGGWWGFNGIQPMAWQLHFSKGWWPASFTWAPSACPTAGTPGSWCAMESGGDLRMFRISVTQCCRMLQRKLMFWSRPSLWGTLLLLAGRSGLSKKIGRVPVDAGLWRRRGAMRYFVDMALVLVRTACSNSPLQLRGMILLLTYLFGSQCAVTLIRSEKTQMHWVLSCFVTRVLALSTRVPALACSALTPMHFSRCAS